MTLWKSTGPKQILTESGWSSMQPSRPTIELMPPLYARFDDGESVPSAYRQAAQTAQKPYSLSKVINRSVEAARFEVRSGDVWGGHTTERSELSGPGLTYEEEWWISYSFRLSMDMNPPVSWYNLGQIHGGEPEEPGVPAQSPMITHNYEGTSLGFLTRHDRNGSANVVTQTAYSLPSFVMDRWYHFVHRFVLSRLGDGQLQVWVDGTERCNVTRPIGYNNPGGPYWKYGIYRSGNNTGRSVAEYQNMEVSPTSLISRVASPLPLL